MRPNTTNPGPDPDHFFWASGPFNGALFRLDDASHAVTIMSCRWRVMWATDDEVRALGWEPGPRDGIFVRR
jgi:hypothetical protein